MINYKEFSVERINEVKEIFRSEGWFAYLKCDDKLHRAFQNSLFLMGAFEKNKLIGLVRCLGDNEHFVIIQDLIIDKEYRRQGIGQKLMEICKEKFSDVRMLCLITDKDDVAANSFYLKMGMKPIKDGNMISYMR